MKEKYYPTIVYNNETISVFLFKMFGNKPYLLYKKDIYFGNVSEVSDYNQINKIASSLKKSLLELEVQYKKKFINVYVMIEPTNFYSKSRKFHYDFQEEILLEDVDVRKLVVKMKKNEELEEGFRIATFIPQKINSDGSLIKRLSGERVHKLVIEGETVFVDQETFTPMDRILEELNRNVVDYIVTNNMLKFSPELENNKAIIEVESASLNFMYKENGHTKNFRVNVGMGHIFEKLFSRLLETYSEEDAYKITKFMQEHQLIEHQEKNFQIIPEVHINDIIDLYNGLFRTYFTGVLDKIKEKKIDLKEVMLISYGYDLETLVTQFNDILKVKTVKYRVSKLGEIQMPYSKLYFAIQKYHEISLY